MGYDWGEARRESYQNPRVGLQARRGQDRLNSKTYVFFRRGKKGDRFWFRSEDLRVVSPKRAITIVWIVRSAGLIPFGNTLTATESRPRLFGIKV
ncbi:MAG: hypothetical protein DWH99_10475 [Planctomycetota bacterium]|nr:MAG: hypothetical protein DWH99_10475 [Planctomycetota bacterium]